MAFIIWIQANVTDPDKQEGQEVSWKRDGAQTEAELSHLHVPLCNISSLCFWKNVHHMPFSDDQLPQQDV